MTLRALGKRDFHRVERQNPYWRGRWPYLRHVVRLVGELEPETVLEIGPGPSRLVPGSDTLDIDARTAPTYHHDAGVVPWPIESGAYDLVLGLQCWEHFDGRQSLAFVEACRVASPRGHVLLSFPYLWRNATAEHRGIDARRIREWTCAVDPVRKILVRQPINRQRLIALFRGGEFRE